VTRAARALVLGIGLGSVGACFGSAPAKLPTRAQIEAEEDRFCRALTRARELERQYGLEPPPQDAGVE